MDLDPPGHARRVVRLRDKKCELEASLKLANGDLPHARIAPDFCNKIFPSVATMYP